MIFWLGVIGRFFCLFLPNLHNNEITNYYV